MCVMSSLEMAARWANLEQLRGLRDWCAQQPGGAYPAEVDKQLPQGTLSLVLSGKATQADRALVRSAFTTLDDDLLARSQQEARAGAKIVVWPEASPMSASILQEDEPALIQQASTLAKQEGIYLARVTPELASDWQIMNGYVGGNGVVRVMQYTSVLEARDSAASQFFPCFGYDRFVIDGDVDLLDDIARHLH